MASITWFEGEKMTRVVEPGRHADGGEFEHLLRVALPGGLTRPLHGASVEQLLLLGGRELADLGRPRHQHLRLGVGRPVGRERLGLVVDRHTDLLGTSN